MSSPSTFPTPTHASSQQKKRKRGNVSAYKWDTKRQKIGGENDVSAPKTPKYHVYNFKQVLSHAAQIHGHLLHQHEKDLIHTFASLSDNAQNIYTRLYNRQPMVFRGSEILERYLMKDEALVSEATQDDGELQGATQESLAPPQSGSSVVDNEIIVIEDSDEEKPQSPKSAVSLQSLTDAIWKELCEQKFVSLMQDEAVLLKTVMKKNELLQIAREMKIKITNLSQRDDIAARILKEHKSTKSGLMKFFTKKQQVQGNSNSALMKVIKKVLGVPANQALEFYSMNADVKAQFGMVHRLFYLNQNEDQTAQVLQNLQIFRYVVNANHVQPVSMFHCREDFDEYEEAQVKWETLGEIAMLKVEGVQEHSETSLPMIDELCKSFERANRRYKEIEQDQWPLFKLRFTPGWIYSRALFHGVAVLEKLKMFEKAATILRQLIEAPFCPGRRGKFYNRLSIDLKHMKEHKQALDVCVDALKHDTTLTFAHRLTLEKRAKQLCKKNQLIDYQYQLIDNYHKATQRTITGKRAPDDLQTKVKTYYVNQRHAELLKMQIESSLSLEMSLNSSMSASMVREEVSLLMTPGVAESLTASTSSQHSRSYLSELNMSTQDEVVPHLEPNLLTVEDLALQHYRLEEQYQGLHCEGAILRMIHNLIFWDIIYDTSVPGVWQSSFQVAPLDMGTEGFFEARRDKILERLKVIENDEGKILDWIELRYEESKEYRCIIAEKMHEKYDVNTLTTLFECIGGKVMAGICRVWCEDERTHSGFPDLVLWNADEKKALFCEVKGPRDRLSDKQNFWINMLVSAGAKVEVCHVKYEGEVSQSQEELSQLPDAADEQDEAEEFSQTKKRRKISRKSVKSEKED